MRRNELLQDIDQALRELTTSGVLAATSIARKVGMGPNDMRCAELLVRNGAMTAGELAEGTGLTTGAITGIVDRLESAGWAVREADPSDRRKVIVRPGPQSKEGNSADLYADYNHQLERLLSSYSKEQLSLILKFIHRITSVNYMVAEARPSETEET